MFCLLSTCHTLGRTNIQTSILNYTGCPMVRIATLNVDIVSVPEPIMKPFKSMKFVCLRIFLMYDNPHNSQYF